jgi:hydroxyacylglutathione hydrolase
MNLEDHLGDILRKARQEAGVSSAEAAKAAGVSESDLVQLEESGRLVGAVKMAPLAEKVGLHGKKLEEIAKGWHPQPRDLSQWRELRAITTTREGITVNCYLVWDEVSREGALFDTGWDAEPILQLIEQNGVQLRYLFLTHTHEDHLAAMGALRDRFPKLLLRTNSSSAPPQQRNRPNDFIHLNSLRITNRDTPGHAEDGVIYIVGNWPDDAPHVALIGDTVFAGSLARGIGSTDLLKQKVRDQIFTLPVETLLCPGHGPLTTVGEEKAHNPFF